MNTLLVCLATSSSALAAGLYLLGRPPARPLGLRRAGLVALGVGLLVGGEAAFSAFELGRFFLAVNIVYCAVSIVLPLLGLALLLLARRRGASWPARGLALAALAIAPLAVHASFIAPYQLVTEETRVPVAAHARMARPIRIAVLSDLQMVAVGDHEREAIRRALDAQPDLILLSGDYVQLGHERLVEFRGAFRELVAPLAAPLGVFAVHGDCESAAEARMLFEGTGVRVLVDESVHLEHDGLALWLCGLENGFGSARSLAALAEFDALAADGELRLVLAHRPDVVSTLAPASPVDLVLCGHTHGGQVQLPWIGPPFILSNVPRAVGAGGLSELGGHKIYVSRGIGWEHGHAPRVRFRCPPEVSILTLVPEARP
jgi:predicted MPP superfamily phosphohydrolase